MFTEFRTRNSVQAVQRAQLDPADRSSVVVRQLWAWAEQWFDYLVENQDNSDDEKLPEDLSMHPADVVIITAAFLM